MHSDSDAVARCEANTQTGTLAEGFFVLDETTEGEGRGVVSQTGSWIKAAKQKQVHPGPVQTALLVPIE